MLTPIAKRVIIQPVEAQQGTILIANKKPSQYKVIAIGDEVTKVKPDDVIYLEKHYGVEIDYGGVQFLVIDEGSILAKLD